MKAMLGVDVLGLWWYCYDLYREQGFWVIKIGSNEFPGLTHEILIGFDLHFSGLTE